MSSTFDLDPLYDACVKYKDLCDYRNELWALHHISRPYLLHTFQDDGEIISGCLTTFILAARSERIIDDKRSMADFPLIVLHKKWTYDAYISVPISRYPQTVVVSLLLGLDWLVFSDLFGPDHTPEFLRQVKEIFFLIQNRILFFINSHTLDSDLLNMPEYREIVNTVLIEAVDTVEYDYASDEETFMLGRNLTRDEFSIKGAHVNTTFLYDMEAYLTHFQAQFAKLETKTIIPRVANHVSLSRLRKHLITKVAEVDHTHVVRQRMDWQHKLQIHEAQERVFRHHNGLSIRTVRPRQIIVNLNDDLITQGEVTSFADLTTRQTGDKKFASAMVRLATDAMLWVWSEQTSGVIQALYPKYIYRQSITNTWIAETPAGPVEVQSLAHGFIELRRTTEKIESIDLKEFDSHIAWDAQLSTQ